MILKQIVIKNFRSYSGEYRISIDQLTAFIGKNDAGKSTIFDALAIFFENPICKIDNSDICKFAPEEDELVIGCVFSDFPLEVVLDTSSKTNLSNEYLLNEQGYIEIHKVFPYVDRILKKAKIYAIAKHPKNPPYSELLSKKNSELKQIAESLGIDDRIDRRSNVALRSAIRENINEVDLELSRVQLEKEDAKAIWDQLFIYFPLFALFRADRPSTDEDDEVQDPLKIAVKQAIEEVKYELTEIKEKVRARTLEVANRTLKKLAEFDSNLASQLRPIFKSEPKWDTIFKLSLTGDNEIPINKRGSGVRRLILFSFFRAEAERLLHEQRKDNIIYAIEEPETAQHPDNQKIILETLSNISESSGSQILLSTHVPALASLLPFNAIRYITNDDSGGSYINLPNEHILERISSDLGIIPDKRVKVLVCVEGPHDIQFLKSMNKILMSSQVIDIDIFSDVRVAIVPLGGSTLKEWVNSHYLQNLGIPEVHIYDRDMPDKNGKYKYQSAKESIDNRGDNSIAFLTQKREMENYLHLDAINDVLKPILGQDLSFTLTDDCDVTTEIINICGQKYISRRPIKQWLNENAAEAMTLERLTARNGVEEIIGWFKAITSRL